MRFFAWLVGLLPLVPVSAQELPGSLIQLTGRQIPRLLGTAVDEVAAEAAHNGVPAPVHLQIDQRCRSQDGTLHYAFQAGDNRQCSPSDHLSEDDMLLLAASEAGERLQPSLTASVEIEVVSAAGGERGWFYLRHGAASRLAGLIEYDADIDRVRGADYALSFSRDGTPVIDSLVLNGANILDRNKARLDVDLALGIGKVSRSEADVRVRTTGICAGPLRIIREAEVRGRLLFDVYSAPVRETFVFYPHGFVLPTTIRLTPTARLLVRGVSLRISMDLDAAAESLTFASGPEVPSPVRVDGKGGQLGGQERIAWYLIRRGDIGLLGWLEAPPDVARDVALYYRDDVGHPDPPERIAGEFGDHGFLYRHTGPLPAGDVRLISHGAILRGDQLERPAEELRALAAQPTVRIH